MRDLIVLWLEGTMVGFSLVWFLVLPFVFFIAKWQQGRNK